jgi:hypothetical protein
MNVMDIFKKPRTLGSDHEKLFNSITSTSLRRTWVGLKPYLLSDTKLGKGEIAVLLEQGRIPVTGLMYAGVCYIRDVNVLLELWYLAEDSPSKSGRFKSRLTDFMKLWANYEDNIKQYSITGYGKKLETFLGMIDFNPGEFKYFPEPHPMVLSKEFDKGAQQTLINEIALFYEKKKQLAARYPKVTEKPPMRNWL